MLQEFGGQLHYVPFQSSERTTAMATTTWVLDVFRFSDFSIGNLFPLRAGLSLILSTSSSRFQKKIDLRFNHRFVGRSYFHVYIFCCFPIKKKHKSRISGSISCMVLRIHKLHSFVVNLSLSMWLGTLSEEKNVSHVICPSTVYFCKCCNTLPNGIRIGQEIKGAELRTNTCNFATLTAEHLGRCSILD